MPIDPFQYFLYYCEILLSNKFKKSKLSHIGIMYKILPLNGGGGAPLCSGANSFINCGFLIMFRQTTYLAT